MRSLVQMKLEDESIEYGAIESLRSQVLIQLESLLTNLSFYNGENIIKIFVEVESMNPHSKYFNNACAKKSSENNYTIILGGGLLLRLEALSRAINVDGSRLTGATKSIWLKEEGEPKERLKILANFCFHYMVNLVFYHEVGHIYKGHIDYFASVNEHGEYLEKAIDPLNSADAAIRRALEADADSYAAKLSTTAYDFALKNNQSLRYNSLEDSYFDLGYLIGAMFSFFESFHELRCQENKSHPSAQERISVMLSFAEDALKKIYGDPQAKVLQSQMIKGSMTAYHEVIYENKPPISISKIGKFVEGVGTELNKIKLKTFKPVIECGVSTFELSKLR